MFLYSAESSPLDRFKRLVLFVPQPPGRLVHSGPNSASPGSILATLQLRAKTNQSHFHPLSIAMSSFIQLSELGHRGENENAQILKCLKMGFKPWLSIASPASFYRAHTCVLLCVIICIQYYVGSKV